MKLIFIIISILINVFVNAQEYMQEKGILFEEGGLLLKTHKGFLKSDLKLIGDSADIYVYLEEDKILLIDSLAKKSFLFDNYLDFSKKVLQDYIIDDSYKSRYSSSVPFSTLYLRHNFVLNKNRISNLEDNKNQFIEKFISSIGLNDSFHKDFSDKDIEKVNKKLKSLSDRGVKYLNNIELPLLIFIGQLIIEKYEGEWIIKDAENDLLDSFLIPDVKIGSKELDLNRRLFRFLYHPDLKTDNKEIDIGTFIYLMEFIINGRIKIGKNNIGLD